MWDISYSCSGWCSVEGGCSVLQRVGVACGRKVFSGGAFVKVEAGVFRSEGSLVGVGVFWRRRSLVEVGLLGLVIWIIFES